MSFIFMLLAGAVLDFKLVKVFASLSGTCNVHKAVNMYLQCVMYSMLSPCTCSMYTSPEISKID